MKNRIKVSVVCLLVLLGKITTGQNIPDTAPELIDEFSKVMSFAVKPYSYYTIVTKMNAEPIMQEQDTMSFKGVFYKNRGDIFYNNGQEEMYLQDSLIIQINQKRKSIWISKVDMKSKEKMNVLPISNEQLQELFQKKYTIQKTKLNGSRSRLNFTTKQKADSSTTITTSIKLDYMVKDYLPGLIEIEMRMQQPVNDEVLSALKNDNPENAKLVQTIGDAKYLVRVQVISVSFGDINNTKEAAMKMPSWKDILDYREAEHEFIAKGLYKDFEVTKTF